MTLNNQIGTVLTGNFTVNFTSVDLPSGYIARFSVFLRQGATGYYPNVFQINGVTQTLVWDGGTPPTPTSSAGAVDVFEFILYSGGSFGTATGRAILSSSSGGGEVVDDTTPQLGGNLDVNGNSIVSVSDGDINLAPNGSGEVTVTGNATISNVAKAYEMIVTSSNAALKLGDGTGSEGYMNIYLNNVSGGAKHIIQSYPTAGGGFKIQNLVNDQAITFETKNSSGTTKTPLILNGDGSVDHGYVVENNIRTSETGSGSDKTLDTVDETVYPGATYEVMFVTGSVVNFVSFFANLVENEITAVGPNSGSFVLAGDLYSESNFAVGGTSGAKTVLWQIKGGVSGTVTATAKVKYYKA
jgi:hypothetical protein